MNTCRIFEKTVQMSLFVGLEQRHQHREWTCEQRGGKGGCDELRDCDRHMYITVGRTDSWWEAAGWHGELGSAHCDDPRGG